MIASSASAVKSLTGLAFSSANSRRKLSANIGMSEARSRSGGAQSSTTPKRKKRSSRNSPLPTISLRFLFVAATMRTSAISVLLPPTRSKVRSPRNRSSLTCVVSSISPISSRNNVPPSACSNRPTRRSCAPVNAPFSWPNNSLSSSVGDSAAQCTVTIGRLERGLSWWIALAKSSLPVPLSPWIKTVARDGATCRTMSITFCIGSDSPMMFSSPNFLLSCCLSVLFSLSRVRSLRARAMRVSSSSICIRPLAK